MRDWEKYRREQKRRELRITVLSWGILVLGAGVIALGLWATVTLLIGAFG